jgi:hypothetical protein
VVAVVLAAAALAAVVVTGRRCAVLCVAFLSADSPARPHATLPDVPNSHPRTVQVR